MNSQDPFTCQPYEIKIEVTAACNLACSFCYQGPPGQAPARHAPEEQVLGWIDWAVDNGVPGVRFTGGEPTVHPSIKFFCNYAHLRGRFVLINTNGMAPEGLYADLLKVVDWLNLSLPTLDPGRMDEITGRRGVLAKKLATMRQALEAGKGVALLTALLPENKGRLEEFVSLVLAHPGVVWGALRLKATPEEPRPWTRQDAQDFALEVADLMDRYPSVMRGIRLAAPFCAVRPLELGARVFHGRTGQCGPYRSLAVGLDGALRACYGAPKPLALAPRPLAEILAGQDLCASAGPEALPEECRACPHVSSCAGGCRNWPGLVEHHGKWVDHLAGFLPAGQEMP